MDYITTIITELPPAPTRDDPANFSDEADAFVAAWPPLVDQINDVGAEMNAAAAAVEGFAQTAVNAPGTTAMSASTLTIAQGVQSLAVQTDKNFAKGMWVTIAVTTAPTNYMVGYITAYDSGTGALSVTATVAQGGGTYDTWIVAISPPLDFAPATKEQIWGGSAVGVGIVPAVLAQAFAYQALAFSTPLNLDGRNFFNATVTVTGNFVLPAPSFLIPGQTYIVDLTMGGTGAYTWAPDTNAYKFPGNQVPAISQGVGVTDELILRALTATTASAALRKARPA